MWRPTESRPRYIFIYSYTDLHLIPNCSSVISSERERDTVLCTFPCTRPRCHAHFKGVFGVFSLPHQHPHGKTKWIKLIPTFQTKTKESLSKNKQNKRQQISVFLLHLNFTPRNVYDLLPDYFLEKCFKC